MTGIERLRDVASNRTVRLTALLQEIADQIERETERTCKLTKVKDCSGLVQGVTQWRLCSRCGIEVLAYPATYCPCCGAKVVME